jgi:hypothetical protein
MRVLVKSHKRKGRVVRSHTREASLSYAKTQAKKLGVIVKPSENSEKKIDVFSKKGAKLASVGATGYNDYPTYLKKEQDGSVAKGTAAMKRAAYKKRHVFRGNKNTPAYFADKLLW